MAKSIKFQNELYLDSSSISHNKKTLDNYLEKHILGVTLSSNVTPTTGAYIEISNWSQTLKIGNKLSISNGKIKIGSGVSYIKIYGQIGCYSNTNDLFYMLFKKNGTSIGTWQVMRSFNTYIIMPINQIIPVSEGDIISMATYQGGTYSLEYGKTGVFFEVIE